MEKCLTRANFAVFSSGGLGIPRRRSIMQELGGQMRRNEAFDCSTWIQRFSFFIPRRGSSTLIVHFPFHPCLPTHRRRLQRSHWNTKYFPIILFMFCYRNNQSVTTLGKCEAKRAAGKEHGTTTTISTRDEENAKRVEGLGSHSLPFILCYVCLFCSALFSYSQLFRSETSGL
jgi:hypothetical protein